VGDLTQQLASEKSKVKELDDHLETQRDITRGLQEQISLLEQRIQSEEARSKEVKVCCMISVQLHSFLQ
jgi:phage shock protein A